MGQYHRTLVIWVEHKSLPKLLRFLIWIVCLNWTNSPSDIKWSTYIWTQEHFLRTFAETALFCEQFIDQGVYQPGDRQTQSIGFKSLLLLLLSKNYPLSKLILLLIISFLFIVEDDLARDLIFGDPYITKHSKVHCFCIFTQRWLGFLSLSVTFGICLCLFVFVCVFFLCLCPQRWQWWGESLAHQIGLLASPSTSSTKAQVNNSWEAISSLLNLVLGRGYVYQMNSPRVWGLSENELAIPG